MADLGELLTDLAAEGESLDALVAGLAEPGWSTPTPADGWTIAHQIAHLAWTDEVATLAATDPERFVGQLEAALADVDGFVDRAAEERVGLGATELLARWRDGRRSLIEALAAVPAGVRLPWFGPPMAAPSMATARLMETFAHGQDVADALEVTRTPTDRLRHICHIGVRTRDFAFASHRLDPPAEAFRFELRSPDGELWSWGPEDAGQRITGPALDFCLLVTQRRHPDDLNLVASGDDARRWVPIAQAFAGPPGSGREPIDTAAPRNRD